MSHKTTKWNHCIFVTADVCVGSQSSGHGRLDLLELKKPLGWEVKHLQEIERSPVAFLEILQTVTSVFCFV